MSINFNIAHDSTFTKILLELHILLQLGILFITLLVFLMCFAHPEKIKFWFIFLKTDFCFLKTTFRKKIDFCFLKKGFENRFFLFFYL